MDSLATVLRQEIVKFNMLKKMESSMHLLQMAIDGLELMSPELEVMYSDMLDNRKPENWVAVSYSSPKLLFWIIDTSNRVEFLRKWSKGRHTFPLSVFSSHRFSHRCSSKSCTSLQNTDKCTGICF